jgi:agmatinase
MKFTNYGGIPDEYSTFENSKIVILPVPYEGSCTWQKGADKGPRALLEASVHLEKYDITTDSEVHKLGIHTAEAITENSSPEAVIDEVYKQVKAFYKKKKFPIVLGGDHSISIGAFKAVSEQYSDLTIVQFDAHADLRRDQKGSKICHSSVMAHAREMASIIQVGIRSMSVEERDDVQPDRIFYANIIRDSTNWKYDILNKLTRNVYITIDLDVFDPSIMPATGSPEPGGIRWYQMLEILRLICEHANLVGFDMVELRPLLENRAPDFTAAKLIYSLLTFKFISGIQ